MRQFPSCRKTSFPSGGLSPSRSCDCVKQSERCAWNNLGDDYWRYFGPHFQQLGNSNADPPTYPACQCVLCQKLSLECVRFAQHRTRNQNVLLGLCRTIGRRNYTEEDAAGTTDCLVSLDEPCSLKDFNPALLGNLRPSVGQLLYAWGSTCRSGGLYKDVWVFVEGWGYPTFFLDGGD